MKRISYLSLVLVLLLAAFAFASGTSEKSSQGPAKLTFVTVANGDPEKQAFDDIFAAFNKKTQNTVEQQILPNVNEYENIIKTRFATNDPPDVFYFFTGANEYNTLQATKNLVEFSGQPWLKDLSSAVKSFYTVEGKIYGMPWGSYNALGVFYNKEDFAKLGLTPPKNYADFLAICAKLKAAGITPLYEAGKTGWPVQIFSLAGFQTFVLPTIGGMEGVKKLGNNTLRIKDIPEIRKVFEMQYALKTKGYYNKDLASGTYENQQAAIATGSAAMVLQGDWMLPSVAKNYPKDVNNIGFFPLPSNTADDTPTLYPPKQIMVTKAGKHVDATLSLLKFMTTPEMLNVWYTHNPGIPVYTNVTTTKIFPAQEDIYKYIKEGKGAINVQLLLPSNYVPDYDKVTQNFMLTGDLNKTIQIMDQTYEQQGKDKHIPGF